MANVRWVGDAIAVRQVDLFTITAAGAGGTTFKVTCTGTGNVASYLAVSGDTVTTVAENLIAAINAAASGPAPEFADYTASNVAGAITAMGPEDGAPIAFTTSVTGGAGTISGVTAVTAASGPNDLNVASNYSGGALPSAADVLIFENGSSDAKYNATALAGIALTKVIRRTTWTGRLGLPVMNEAGYREFRSRYVQFDATTIEWEVPDSDGPGQAMMQSVKASASTLYVIGQTAQAGSPGNEPLWFWGQVSTSAISIVGSGIRICPETGQTNVVSTVNAVNASLYVGAGATPTDIFASGSISNIVASYTTFTQDRGGTSRVGDVAGAVTSTTIQDGVLLWQSTGGPATLTLGSGSTFDATISVSGFSVTVIVMAEGSRLLDPNAKIVKPYDIGLQNTQLDKVFIDAGTGHGLTVTT